MKFLIVFAALAFFSGSLAQRAILNIRLTVDGTRIVNQLNATVNSLIAARVPNPPTPLTDDLRYFWDMLPPVTRYLLLNQVQIRNQWNVLTELQQGKTKLDWATIPQAVRNILVNQKVNLGYLDLTFSQWGWTDGEFGSTTLSSLVNQENQAVLAQVKEIANKISYSDVISISKFRQELATRDASSNNRGRVLTNIFFGLFNQITLPFRIPTAGRVVRLAADNANRVLVNQRISDSNL